MGATAAAGLVAATAAVQKASERAGAIEEAVRDPGGLGSGAEVGKGLAIAAKAGAEVRAPATGAAAAAGALDLGPEAREVAAAAKALE